MTTRPSDGFWQHLFGLRGGGSDAPAPEAPPLFRPRPLPPPEPKGPGLPAWHEILSAAPPVPQVSGARFQGARPPTEAERHCLTEIGALLAAGQIGEAAALLDATLRERPEVCDAAGRPIYLLESLHCALLLGAAEAAADRAARLRPFLAPDDPVIEVLYARVALAADDRAAARANWQAALARAPGLVDAEAWLAANPASPVDGVPVIDLLGPEGAAFAARIPSPPALTPAPDGAVEVPDWTPGRLLTEAALWVAEDGSVQIAPTDARPTACSSPGAEPGELAIALCHPEGLGRPYGLTELLLATFVLHRQHLAHLRPARLYVGRWPWANPADTAAMAAAELVAALFPGIRMVGAHDGAVREAQVLRVDGALSNPATGTLLGSMMPQVVQHTAEARARLHAACGLPGTAEPPWTAGRRPRVLYLNTPPPNALAEPVRERLFGLFVAAGYEVAVADMAALPWQRQVRLAYGADIITGAHGAAFSAVLWAHPQTRVLEFFPEGTRRYDGQLFAEAARLAYLGLEGVTERGFLIRARERWGPPVGQANRLIWALPWTMLERAVAPAKKEGGRNSARDGSSLRAAPLE